MTTTIKLLLGCAAACVGLFTTTAHAFCVQNNVGGNLKVFEQTSPEEPLNHMKTFESRVAQGENKCCNWQNADCNPAKRQNAILGTYVYICDAGGMHMNEARDYIAADNQLDASGPSSDRGMCGGSNALPIVPTGQCGLTGTEINKIAKQARLPVIDKWTDKRIVLLEAGGWLELANINGATVMKSFRTGGSVLYTFPCYNINKK
jgi:hypothetical protein